ncbi:ComEA family DNA-binding protein [Musicola paradisiaca]|uniref:Uncharacterized protein YbaV n=1 Tax=Musicola paradisiaca (strain Ech703) TaxID=579405 RepID=C6CBB8_MUSP7|nr:helix-hairpin-helix domain-containing protein [Musicola paradisiaca]ACS86646.1 competence protein ComEA helix-hairpin-helix repeat protein [Musicola paradisiaca Ech703]
MRKSGIKALCLLMGMALGGISPWLQAATPKAEPEKSSVSAAAEHQQGKNAKSALTTDEEEVSINTASAEQLAAALNGVGLKKAQAIVAYREQNGPFTQIEQLQEVPGIGAALVERNQSRIRL